MIIFLKFCPGLVGRAERLRRFLGLSPLGYICYAILWVAQAAVFWRGMEAIRKFIDFAGPAVYVVMIMLCVYLVSQAGISNISLNLAEKDLSVAQQIGTMVIADRAGGVLLLRARC